MMLPSRQSSVDLPAPAAPPASSPPSGVALRRAPVGPGVEARAFVERLAAFSEGHEAVAHPYLDRIAHGDLPCQQVALRDFAHQYGFYSSGFTTYLAGVLGQTTDHRHRRILEENLEEEHGLPPAGLDPELARCAARPHAELFADFRRQVGVDASYALLHPPCATVHRLRQGMIDACTQRGLAAGVAALGFATELIVPAIYRALLAGIRRDAGLGEDAARFFEIHAHCDEGHAGALLEIATDLAADGDARRTMWATTRRILGLRAEFWDELAQRADAFGRRPSHIPVGR